MLSRFGPQALKWEKVTTMQDYFMHGMGHSVVYYAVCIAALMFWNKIAPRDLAFVSAFSPAYIHPISYCERSGTTCFSSGLSLSSCSSSWHLRRLMLRPLHCPRRSTFHLTPLLEPAS